MEIRQFEDKNLAHYSYAIYSNGEIAVIDPARDPQRYYDFANEMNGTITAVIETHPHADFVSSHLEIHQSTGATIYASKLLGAEYDHQTFDNGDAIVLGNITLKAYNTPGHSPDSITVLALDENGNPKAVFTGDTLFIGDCGRPDLREKAGAITLARRELARQMYHSLRDVYLKLPDDVLVYPAHGAGSLCGKGLSKANNSTIGNEKISNWCLQSMTEDEFINQLLADQPFVPKYFPYDVGINKKGAKSFKESISKIPRGNGMTPALDTALLIIDARPQEEFKKSHLKNAVNLMEDVKFETWLGSIINPGERFYLIANSKSTLEKLIERSARIGYEGQIELAFVNGEGEKRMDFFDSKELKKNPEAFTILDIRNESEVKSGKIFPEAIHIPLHELRERTGEIPVDKPIVVHCAGGFRSAAGSSIIQSKLGGTPKVYDLSVSIREFKK